MAITRRRRFIIDWGLQLGYMGFIIFGVTFLFVFMAFFHFYNNKWLTDALMKAYPQMKEILSRTNREILVRNILFTIVYLLAMASLAILIAHRIAGPAYRIEKCLRGITDGDYSLRLKLRRRDELGKLAEAFNRAAESLRERASSDSRVAEELSKGVKDLSRAIKAKSISDEDISRSVEELSKAIESFRQSKKRYSG